MGFGRIVSCCAVVCALAVGAAGCGDSGSESTAQNAGKTSADATPWTGKVPAALADVGERLEKAGYQPGAPKDAKPTKANPGFIRVLMHEGAAAFISIATKDLNEKGVEAEVARSRGRFTADFVGSHVYIASSGLNLLNGKKELTDEQIAEFHEIVRAGSDQE